MKRSHTRARRALLALSIAATCLAAACYTSVDPRTDPTLRSPLGVHGEVDVGGSRYAGELLTITAADFTLLTDRRLVVIPFTVAGDGRFKSIGIGTYGPPWPANAEQLKYASRYPYGIPAVALEAILRQHGQTAPDTARLPAR
jgi:hypothetical protein